MMYGFLTYENIDVICRSTGICRSTVTSITEGCGALGTFCTKRIDIGRAILGRIDPDAWFCGRRCLLMAAESCQTSLEHAHTGKAESTQTTRALDDADVVGC